MMKIVAYKRISDGRIIVRHPGYDYMYIAATPTLPTIFNSGYHCHAYHSIRIKSVFDEVNNGNLEQVDLVDMKWIHPHLLPAIKKQIINYLKNLNK